MRYPCFLQIYTRDANTTWIGLGIAKLVTEKIMGIRWLAYADRMAKKGVLTYKAGNRKRVDLVGLDDNMKWHAVEAKGGRSIFSKTAYAKSQAVGISRVYGFAPDTASACLAKLGIGKNTNVTLVDPEVPANKADSINPQSFLKEYYSPVLAVLRKYGYEKMGDFVYTKTAINYSYFNPPLISKQHEERYKIGIHFKIFENPLSALHVKEFLGKTELEKQSSSTISLGSDGIVIQKVEQ
jgi:hypothetical protein